MRDKYVNPRYDTPFELDDDTREEVIAAALAGEEPSTMAVFDSPDQIARGCSEEMMAQIGVGELSDDDRYVTFVDTVEDGRTDVSSAGFLDRKPRRGVEDAQRVARIDLVQLAYMYMQGATTAGMCKFFGVSRAGLHKATGSPSFKSIQSMIMGATIQTARVFMAGATIKATKTLLSLLDSDSDKIKLAAACQVLDRVGLKSPDQIEVLQNATGMHAMSEKELMLIVKTAMKELPQPAGLAEAPAHE